ncbi:hypothetical protein [Methylobacillus flagellatus]|uniref:Uncharacterized protein n=1 Tax=Methylobacillus flagellatus (strain ATCC 51484 / DSM 6875 / VKM B-1610 / KT) TaxID=265072 RepID=Q1H2P3_METFK|nr:hypothetical protein [Methylobacillus flagellatus]ABE49100.1 hypothetical protein Mfla_0832 [Methylobacillus flagellatus KT]ABE49244.1 hypothetical protein Mfla_0976 [Methylobacillus flagellatus KT]
MFIKAGTLVNVCEGSKAGRFGRVRDVRICDQTHVVLVFVELWDVRDGSGQLHLFEPTQLKGRRYNEAELIAFSELLNDPLFWGIEPPKGARVAA